MGGSKLLDRVDNLIRVCPAYNFAMESDPVTATQAREFGHKLESWRDFSEPVFDLYAGLWFNLTTDGKREQTNPPSWLI